MAVSIDGFSIREYTAKMRSVDVVKCWPFDKSTDKKHVKAMLPPITVKKFSWWLDVAKESDDDDDSDVVVPVNRSRKITKDVVNRGKFPRVQKKRSIVDIFAVAPQVERIDDDDYYDDDDDDENDGINVSVIRNCNRNAKTKKEKKKIVNKLKEVKKQIIKKKVNSNCLDMLIPKEKFDKLNVPNSFSKPSCSQHSKRCGNGIADYSPTNGRKQQKKHLVLEKKTKSLTNSKLSSNHQKTMIPVCCPLKKRTKRLPVENSASGISCEPNDANFCSNQQNDKHVNCSDHAAESGEVLSLTEEKGTNKYILRTTENEVTVQPGSPKQLSVVFSTSDAPGLLRHNISNEDSSFECYNNFNQVAEGNDKLKLFRRGYEVASHGSQFPCNPKTLHVPQQMHNHRRKDQIVGSFVEEVPGVCSMHSAKAYSQHSNSSAYENVNRKPYLLPEIITGNCSGHVMQYQPFPQIPSQELMCKICSFPEWKQRESVHGEKGIEEKYVGLPLNSQGELVNLNSNGKRKLTQLPISRATEACSRGLAVNTVELSKCMEHLSDARGWERAPPADQLKLSLSDDSMEWSPTFPVPSRLGIYEYDTGRTNVELDPRKENEQCITTFELGHHFSNLSNHRSKQEDQTKQLETSRSQLYGNSDHVSMLVTPSKMRLMGKEFTVGRRDSHVPQDKSIWTDKQIIAENFPADTCNNYNTVVRNHDQQKLTVHPVLGTLKGVVPRSPSIQINQAIAGPPACPPPFSRQIDLLQQNSLGAIEQSPFSLYHKKLNFEESFTGGYKSFTISSCAPISTSIHDYSSQNGGSRSVDLNSSGCTINFPFLHPDSGKDFRSSWSQLSSGSTPWFLDAKEKKLLMDSDELYSPSVRNHHYCSITGDNRQFDPSVYLASERFCSFTQCPQSVLENPVVPTSMANYSPMPSQIGFRANASTNKRHTDVMKLKGKIISTPYLRDPGHSKKGKKRPLCASDNSINANKIPNLVFGEDPYIVQTPFKSLSNSEGHFSYRQAFESGSVEGKAPSIFSGQSGTSEAGLVSFNCEDTLKFDCTQGSGPIKLTAGVKHVLKPCQYNDQKNIKPTHSTIPIAASTAASTTLETVKPTKIYKF